MRPASGTPHAKGGAEGGFVLLAVLFLVALILIGLAVAAPRVAKDLQRDKETELYHRGLQYARAVRLFYRKTGGYPTDLSQLENTNNIRFLRKRYVDPITGQPFRIIHQGEAKSPLLGLFGQPATIQGATPVGTPIGSPVAGTQNGTGNSLFASNTNSSTTNPSANTSGSTTTTGTSADTSGGQPGSNTSTGFGTPGSTGSTTVIGRIVGVSSTSPKESIRVYKKQTHYNQWEFVYDQATDAMLGGVGGIPQGGNNGQTGLNGPGTTGNPANPVQNPGGLQTNPQQPQPANPAPQQ
jgi:type II secretory pathway pseudopilin PulG